MKMNMCMLWLHPKIFESTFSIKILHFDDSINIHVVYELILIIGEYV